MRFAIFFVAFIFAVTLSGLANAQSDSQTNLAPAYTVADSGGLGWDNVRDPMGGIPFLQGALGAADYDTVDGIFNGHQLNVRGGLSYYMPDRSWVFDGAFGFHHAKIDDGDSSLLAGVVEASARYRFFAYWHAGPILNVFLGNGGTFKSSSSLLTSFLGVEMARDIPLDNNIMRISMRIMTDINVPDVRANMVLLNFGWSFPIGRTSPEVIANLEDARGIKREQFRGPVLVEENESIRSETLALETEAEELANPSNIYRTEREPAGRRRVEDLAAASIGLPTKANTTNAKPRAKEVAKAQGTPKSAKAARHPGNMPKQVSAEVGSEMALAQEIASESNTAPVDSYSAVPVVPGNSDELTTRAAAVGRGEEAPGNQTQNAGEMVRIKVADFGIGRVVPQQGQERKLERLGQALAQNSHLYDRIEVIGHSDSNGKKKNLNKVAEYRARGVMEIFVKSGIPRSIMKSQGQGDAQTLGQNKWERLDSRNRRVEVIFHGVRTPKELNRLVERMLQ